jgi:ATP-dependent Clp protease ATP-binding subunit ClpA
MFARFSPRAREAMVLAREQSGRLRHPWLGTEHLLLGLALQSDTRAKDILSHLGVTHAAVEHELLAELGEHSREQPLGSADEEALRTLGIDLQEVRRRVESVFGSGALDQARAGRCGLPMMPRLKQSLEHASRVAGRGPIHTDHLLIGMTEVRGALAVTLLQRLGVTAGTVSAAFTERQRQAS